MIYRPKYVSTLVMLAFIMLIAIQTAASAAINAAVDKSGPSFIFNLAAKGNEYELMIAGRELNDLYAFEMVLAFDEAQLVYQKAHTELTGFLVEPIVADNRIRIAHTKIGKVAGENGTAALMTVVFKRSGELDTSVILQSLELVDSKLETVKLHLNEAIEIKGAPRIGLNDIAGHWAEKTIREAVSLGFVTGYTDGSFRPQREITRGEFAAMTVRALKLNVEERMPTPLADEPHTADWVKPYIYAMASAGVINGYPDHTIRAAANITRAEMAAMLVRLLDLESEVNAKSPKPPYADASTIPVWAGLYVSSISEAEIMSGKTGSRFAANDYATRAEAATVIHSLLSRFER